MNKMAKAITFLVLLLIFPAAYEATTYTVGDSQGWTIGADYTSWASGKTFAVGDKLVFNYASNQHSVEEVSQSDYSGCSSANPISSDSNGPTTVTLSTAGNKYFICSLPGHCASGMKLVVTVTPGRTGPSDIL